MNDPIKEVLKHSNCGNCIFTNCFMLQAIGSHKNYVCDKWELRPCQHDFKVIGWKDCDSAFLINAECTKCGLYITAGSKK